MAFKKGTRKNFWSLLLQPLVLNNQEIQEFWLLTLIIILVLLFLMWLIIRKTPIFELEDIIEVNTIILIVLSIVTFVIGIEINEITSLGIFLLLLISQTACISWFVDMRIKKSHSKAQQIFQEQLIFYEPDYQELMRCYYHGGEKYKEKLMNTEKFSKVIVKNELKSLKDFKTYDNYRLYKAFKYRTYLDLKN